MAHLSNEEVSKLRDAGFGPQELREVAEMKVAAGGETQKLEWAELISTLIQNGPKVIAFGKLLVGLFGKKTQPVKVEEPIEEQKFEEYPPAGENKQDFNS